MPAYTENLIHTLTYWAPAGNDGTGGTEYAAGVEISGRWQNKAVMFRDAQGRETVSEAVVYVDRELAIAGRILYGVSTEAEPVAAAKEIRQTGASPSLGGESTLYKVML